jgi:hypothetical protein
LFLNQTTSQYFPPSSAFSSVLFTHRHRSCLCSCNSVLSFYPIFKFLVSSCSIRIHSSYSFQFNRSFCQFSSFSSGFSSEQKKVKWQRPSCDVPTPTMVQMCAGSRRELTRKRAEKGITLAPFLSAFPDSDRCRFFFWGTYNA